ncbi:MAG: MFS transporter [Mesorhizobium amorphae]|nr:MAG: MFS transporter [Mesorhizobium amorphae]
MARGTDTAFVLAAASAILGSAGPIAISMGGLAGAYLLAADKSLATAPVTGFNLGVAIGALPAAWLVRRLGQRNGFQLGTLATAAGGAVATLALFLQGFWLFALGLLLVGVGASFVQQFRFAAADNAEPAMKARAISFVLAGGIVTAILGPQIVIFTRELFAPVMFAGSFASLLVLSAIGAVVLNRLPSTAVGTTDHHAAEAPARPLREIIRQPRFAVALLCAVGTYALMTFVMTGAPLAMVGCGFSPDEATLGISWHVMAMFGPSFFTGRLIGRFGAERVVAVGLALLIACAFVALSGIALWQFWTSLVLLGLGWNFGFIGSTAIVASTYRPSEKSRAQGFHDFVLFGSVATASLLSGLVLNAYGWDMLNWAVLPVCALCLAALAWLALRTTPQPA